MKKKSFAFLSVFFLIFTACDQKKEKASTFQSELTMQEAFTHVYDLGEWGKNEKGEGTSGSGSLPINVKPYVSFLQHFIKEHDVKHVVDLGCGDWQFSRSIDWSSVRYMGFDVVKSVIAKNVAAFEKPHITFACADAVSENLPCADLLICKDVMQHLLEKDIFLLSKQLNKFKYCLITNDVDPVTLTSPNHDLPFRGAYRLLDLTAPPYNFKAKKVLTYAAEENIVKQVILIEREEV